MPQMPGPGDREKSNNELVVSFLAVRRFIGVVGVAVPLLLILYSLTAAGGRLAPSISDYFHTGGREIMVGGLCAVAVFLLSYQGFQDDPRRPSDRAVARTAAIAAFGVAFFPNKLAAGEACSWLQCLLGDATKYVHYLSAIVFFAALAVFCLVNFRRAGIGQAPDPDKRERNAIFLLCGIGLVISLAAIIAGSVLNFGGSFVFWSESIGVWIFAISWLFKGQSLQAIIRLVARRRGQG